MIGCDASGWRQSKRPLDIVARFGGEEFIAVLGGATVADALYYAKAARRNCVVFSKDGEYVTYNPVDHDLDSTNVIKLLAGDGTTRRKPA